MWAGLRPAILCGHALSEISEIRQVREMRQMRQISPTLFFGHSGGKSDAADPFSILPKSSFELFCNVALCLLPLARRSEEVGGYDDADDGDYDDNDDEEYGEDDDDDDDVYDDDDDNGDADGDDADGDDGDDDDGDNDSRAKRGFGLRT